ncbi:MAG: TonB-dependent receptor plug domain-containing protein [Saprospiraceae bacterium]
MEANNQSSQKIVKIILASLFSLVISSHLAAQESIIKVLDENKSPLIGASVHNGSGKMIGITNEQGEYLFKFEGEDTVTLKYLGYKDLARKINSSSVGIITFIMEALPFSLQQVTVTHSVKATNMISDIDLNIRPVTSSQEVLRTVPGLFIGQHAGGGKAEQMFLRGFDVDHGTDVSVSMDGMPVNMVSHAHGQGYADLHFIIPELIDKVDFGKGPYYADKGDFNTAAYVNFQLKQKLDQSQIKLEVGQYNSLRTAALVNLYNTIKTQSYIAGEFNQSDGWFESPQNFYRTNLMARWQTKLNDRNTLSILASVFDSRWNASGQIPTRVVESGKISRFGALDSTEGGQTARQNMLARLDTRLGHGLSLTQSAFISHYDFDLYSNFTFFLNDPINGDQIRQKENRNLAGYQTTLTRKRYTDDKSDVWNLGFGFRFDRIKDIQLDHTVDRNEIISTDKLGNVHESNAYLYYDYHKDLGKWLINPSLRYDYFLFNYNDKLSGRDLQKQKGRLSPKLNIIYQPDKSIQYYVKSGIGFHSNDARVILQSGADKVLPAATGIDIGTIWKPTPHIYFNAAVWMLDLQQEFVYVGDEGIIEPSGRTRRLGTDFSVRYQPLDWLFFNVDFNYSNGRNRDNEPQFKYIPLAPVLAGLGSVTINKKSWNASASFRHLSARPATEDNSIVAKGYLVNDLSGRYHLGRFDLHFRIENLFNVEWNETQFATLSRLKNEVNPIEEIHFTPGTPFFIKTGLSYNF